MPELNTSGPSLFDGLLMAKCFQNWELSSGENLLSTKMAGGCAPAQTPLLSARIQLQLDQTGLHRQLWFGDRENLPYPGRLNVRILICLQYTGISCGIIYWILQVSLKFLWTKLIFGEEITPPQIIEQNYSV